MIRRVLQALPLRRHRIMLDAMTAAERLLSYWQIGLIHADDIVEWADRLITEAPPGVIVPPWLITLSTRGPKAYSRLAERGSPRPRLLSFDETFDALLEAYFHPDLELTQLITELCTEGEILLRPHLLMGAACALRLQQIVATIGV